MTTLTESIQDLHPEWVVDRDSQEKGASPEILLVEEADGPVLVPIEGGFVPKSLRGSLALRGEELARFEAFVLATRGGSLGLRRVHTPSALLSGGEEAAEAPGGARSLLLIHGIFSHTSATFRGLAEAEFYGRLRGSGRYGDRIYGFNHVTASESIVASARRLLAALPAEETTYDVVAHSRGGLVARTIVERGEELFGALHRRFRLGRLVLAGVPNHGSELASSEGLAALLRLLQSGVVFGQEALYAYLLRLLSKVRGRLPGLLDMTPDGPFLVALNGAKRPIDLYGAIAADFEPGGVLGPADDEVDAVLGDHNDIAVPTVDACRCGHEWVPRGRVFATAALVPPPIDLEVARDVHHLSLFEQAATRSSILEQLL